MRGSEEMGPEALGTSSGPTEEEKGTPRGTPRPWWRRRWLRSAVQALLTVVVTVFILRAVGVSFDQVLELDPGRWSPDPFLLFLSSTLLLAAYLASAVFWGRIVDELGGGRVGAWRACRIYFAANLGRYVPGKVLQVVGLAYLAGRAGLKPSAAVAAGIVGQGLTLVGAALVGLGVLWGHSPSVGPGTSPLVWTAMGVAAGLFALVSVPPIFHGLLRLGAWLLRAGGGEATVPKPGGTFGLRWAALYTANWGLFAVAFWLLVRSVDVDGSLVVVGSAFAASYLLGYLALFAPAGIGVREGFLVAFLEPVAGGGGAVAIAVLARLWSTAVEVLPAALLTFVELREGQGG